MVEAHRRTLDQLSTGVAIFGSDHRLTFYNAAYRALWDLDASFLDQGPTDAETLEQLRSSGKLPEEHNFRQWKNDLHEAYRAIEAREHTWHLPDGRTLRVVTTPNPEGGVTYLFHDVTRRLEQSGMAAASFFLNYGYVSSGGGDEARFNVPAEVFNGNSVRLAFEVVGSTPLKGRRVLDVGCGRGGTVAVLAEKFGALATGVDLSPEAIAFQAIW